MIINIIVTLIILGFSYYFCIKYYKKCESSFERIVYIVLVLMETFIVALYYLDRYNIPTILNWNQNVNTQNWLSILSNFGTSIISEILGGVILFFITIMQINRTLEDNRNRDNEERRISNLPLLKYSFLDNVPDNSNRTSIDSKIKDGIIDEIILNIKNIGMNTARKCYINVNSDVLIKEFCFQLNEQSSLEKGEDKTINFILYLKPDNYKFSFKIYYQDLTFNWYVQRLELEYELLPITNNGMHFLSTKKLIVHDEIKLQNKPKLKIEQ